MVSILMKNNDSYQKNISNYVIDYNYYFFIVIHLKTNTNFVCQSTTLYTQDSLILLFHDLESMILNILR